MQCNGKLFISLPNRCPALFYYVFFVCMFCICLYMHHAIEPPLPPAASLVLFYSNITKWNLYACTDCLIKVICVNILVCCAFSLIICGQLIQFLYGWYIIFYQCTSGERYRTVEFCRTIAIEHDRYAKVIIS